MLDPNLDAEQKAHLARQWVLKAESDLFNASLVLKAATGGPLDTVCFHAQQCVEKYVKALLTFGGIDFQRTHDIGVILALLPAHIRPHLTPEEQARLNDYAVTLRYPGDYEPVSAEEATAALELARRVRAEVRRHLPRAVQQT